MIFSIDQISWTLIADVEFFLLISILMVFKKINQKGFVLAGFILVILSLISSMWMHKWSENIHLYRIANVLVLGGFCLTFMLIGSVLYDYYDKRSSLHTTIAAVVFLYGCFLVCCASYITDSRSYIISYTFSLVIFLISMMLQHNNRCRKLFQNKIISFIAGISFPLYILHGLNGYILETVLYNAGVNNWCNFGITIVAVVSLAYLLHVICEKPIGRIAQRGICHLLR